MKVLYCHQRKRDAEDRSKWNLAKKEHHIYSESVLDPKILVFRQTKREFLLAEHKVIQLIWVKSRMSSITSSIPSWTGFNIKIRNDIPILKSTIGYSDSIDSPATEMSTLSEILSRCLKIKVKLNLPVIVCVFDQAIYAKAVEIKWTYPDKFESCILMLGFFHMLMMFLGIIGKRYKDAGLKDVLVQVK